MAEADNVLLGRWSLQHDSEAFNLLVDRYGPLVYGACLRILRDPEAASDATQESFAALARAGNPGIRSVPAWLHGVATNRSLNVIRSDSRRRSREREYSELHDHASVVTHKCTHLRTEITRTCRSLDNSGRCAIEIAARLLSWPSQ